MPEPPFLSLEDILFIHQQEIETGGGEPSIRDQEGVKACVDAPKASFSGNISTICLEWQRVTSLV